MEKLSTVHSSCRSKYYKKTQMNTMILCSPIDHNKIFYKKNAYCVFRVHTYVFIIKTTSKKIKMAKNLYHSILQCIFLVKNLKNIYSRSSFMCRYYNCVINISSP